MAPSPLERVEHFLREPGSGAALLLAWRYVLAAEANLDLAGENWGLTVAPASADSLLRVNAGRQEVLLVGSGKQSDRVAVWVDAALAPDQIVRLGGECFPGHLKDGSNVEARFGDVPTAVDALQDPGFSDAAAAYFAKESKRRLLNAGWHNDRAGALLAALL